MDEHREHGDAATRDGALATPSQTATEAQKIFRSIFGSSIPPALEEQFNAVPDSVFPPLTEQMRRSYRRIIDEVSDLEALEFASRLRGRNLLLRLKFLLMVYLAECHPPLRDRYVNRHDRSLVRVAVRFASGGLAAVLKLIKGLWLLRRYDGP